MSNRRFGDNAIYIPRFTIVAILMVGCIAFLIGAVIGMAM